MNKSGLIAPPGLSVQSGFDGFEDPGAKTLGEVGSGEQ